MEPLMYRVHRAGCHCADSLIADPDRESIGVKPGAFTIGTSLGQLVLTEEDPDVLLVTLFLETFEEGKDPDISPLLCVQQLPPVRRLQLGPGLMSIRTDG